MANKMREWSASERKSAQTSAKAWQDFFVKVAPQPNRRNSRR